MNVLRRRWLTWNLKRRRNGDPKALQRLYRMPDPWGLDVPEEHFRFQETARLVRERIGANLRSLLEIGCGEGLQTQYFAPLAGSIMGIDPSPLAVERAQRRHLENARFRVGDLTSFLPEPKSRFQLVTACEVLYYMQDVEAAFRKLNNLGEWCLVTYYNGVFDRLDPFFFPKKLNSDLIQSSDCQWRVIWWQSKSVC